MRIETKKDRKHSENTLASCLLSFLLCLVFRLVPALESIIAVSENASFCYSRDFLTWNLVEYDVCWELHEILV